MLHVHVYANVYVCVSILVWGLTDYDCISIGFFFFLLCKRRAETQTEKWDQMGKLIFPFPRHIPFQIAWSSLWRACARTLVRCTASSTTQGITGANEVWEWDRDEASGKEVDQRNRSRERERERGRGRTINLIAGKSIGKGRAGEEDGERKFGGEQSEIW